MTGIYYDLVNFTSSLPNGLVSPSHGNHGVPMARLVWAAATIGITPFGSHSRRHPLELQWREAMMRGCIQPGGEYFHRSESYERLDPSEKGAVSFFLGQAQAKLFAHDFFRISRFVHYDAYLAHHGKRRNRTRPDFLGYHGKEAAIAVEAKGRSRGWEIGLVESAKRQACSLPSIDGYPMPTAYAHIAYFEDDQWCARLEDPPQQGNAQSVDPAALAMAYYIPIVAAVRERQVQPESVQIWDEVRYLRTYFEEVDTYLSVREDIAEHVPTGERLPLDQANFELAGSPLYDLTLSLDDESASEAIDPARKRSPEDWDSELFFLGDDGVAVELGPSWRDWSINGIE
jgi:hypothetical protein